MILCLFDTESRRTVDEYSRHYVEWTVGESDQAVMNCIVSQCSD